MNNTVIRWAALIVGLLLLSVLLGCVEKTSPKPMQPINHPYTIRFGIFDGLEDDPICERRLVEEIRVIEYIPENEDRRYRFGFDINTTGKVTCELHSPGIANVRTPNGNVKKATGIEQTEGRVIRARSNKCDGYSVKTYNFAENGSHNGLIGSWKLKVYQDGQLLEVIPFRVYISEARKKRWQSW